MVTIWGDMLIKLKVMIISLCICISKCHDLHFKYEYEFLCKKPEVITIFTDIQKWDNYAIKKKKKRSR